MTPPLDIDPDNQHRCSECDEPRAFDVPGAPSWEEAFPDGSDGPCHVCFDLTGRPTREERAYNGVRFG